MLENQGSDNPIARQILVTGAARSGKSEWAEKLARDCEKAGQAIVYVATAQRYAEDQEWEARIMQHVDRRPMSWQTIEVGVDLAAVISSAVATDCLLIDSLGSWVGQGLELEEQVWQAHLDALCESLANCPASIVFVAEETGWGVIPAYPMGRLFRDRLGRVIRVVGQRVEKTFLVVAGFAIDVQKIGVAIDGR